jgi:hypothetical protein
MMKDIIKEYIGNGRKIAAHLLEKQQKDLHQVSKIFQNDCRELYLAFGNASETTRQIQHSLVSKRKALDELRESKHKRLQIARNAITTAVNELKSVENRY